MLHLQRIWTPKAIREHYPYYRMRFPLTYLLKMGAHFRKCMRAYGNIEPYVTWESLIVESIDNRRGYCTKHKDCRRRDPVHGFKLAQHCLREQQERVRELRRLEASASTQGNSSAPDVHQPSA
jgi:hypothetical protein